MRWKIVKIYPDECLGLVSLDFHVIQKGKSNDKLHIIHFRIIKFLSNFPIFYIYIFGYFFRAQLWLRNCGRIIENSTENLHNNYRVCEDHFEDTMFLNNLKNRLQPHAIPTATNANANISNNEITFSNSKGKPFILV